MNKRSSGLNRRLGLWTALLGLAIVVPVVWLALDSKLATTAALKPASGRSRPEGKGGSRLSATFESEPSAIEGASTRQSPLSDDDGGQETATPLQATVPTERSLGELQVELASVSKRFVRERHALGSRLFSEGNVLHSSQGGSADPGLAPPDKTEDRMYLIYTRKGRSALIEFRREDYRDLFALRDLREELRGRVEIAGGGAPGAMRRAPFVSRSPSGH